MKKRNFSRTIASVAVGMTILFVASESNAENFVVPSEYYYDKDNFIYTDKDQIVFVFESDFSVRGNVIGRRAESVEDVRLHIKSFGTVGDGITAGWINKDVEGTPLIAWGEVVIENGLQNCQSQSCVLKTGADIVGAAIYGEEGAEAGDSDGSVKILGNVEVGKDDDRGAVFGIYSQRKGNVIGRVTIGSQNTTDNVLVHQGVLGAKAVNGTVKAGSVEIFSGEYHGVVRGAEGKIVKNGSVTIHGGTFSDVVEGSYSDVKDGEVAFGSVVITGGEFDADVSGASTLADVSSAAKGNVTISGSGPKSIEVGGSVYGVKALGASSVSGTVEISAENLTVDHSVYGGYSEAGKVTGSKVKIYSGTITENVYGGRAKGLASENSVTLSNAHVKGYVLGGESRDGDAVENEVLIYGNSLIDGKVYGGLSQTGNSFTGNTLTIKSDFSKEIQEAANFNTIIFEISGDSSIKTLDVTARIGESSTDSGDETEIDKYVHIITAAGPVVFDSKVVTGGSEDGGFTVGVDNDNQQISSHIVLVGDHDFTGTAQILSGSRMELGQEGVSAQLSKGSVYAMNNSSLIFNASEQAHYIGSSMIVEKDSTTYAVLGDRNIIAGPVMSAYQISGDINADQAVVHVSGEIKVDSGAKLYLAGANAGNTYLFAYSDKKVDNETDGWRESDNLLTWDQMESTNALLTLRRVNGDTERNSVMISAFGKEDNPADALPCADIPLNLNQLVDGQLISVDSQAPGARFLSRATDSRYILGGEPEMTRTINSAAHLANAGGVKHLSFAGSNLFENSIDAHLSLARTLELEDNVHLHLKEHQDLWVDVTGLHQRLKNIPVCSGSTCSKPTEYGLDMDMGLLIVGLDRTFDENTHGGLAVMGGHGSIDSRGDFNSTSNSANMWGVAIYGGWDKDNWNLTGNATYTHIHSDVTQRLPATLQMGSSLNADITSHVWGLGIRGEYRYELSESFDLLPHLGLRWQRLTTTGFNTKAQGETVARTKRDRQDVWTVPVGVGIQGIYRTDSDWTIRPQADLSMLFSFGDLKDETKVSFTGVNAWDTMQSRIVDKRTTAVSVGVDVQKHNKSFGLNYSFMDSRHSTGHILMAKFVYRFGDYYERKSSTNSFRFAFDKSGMEDIPVNDRQVLDAIFDPYEEVLSVDISGHTDRLGRNAYNQKLSEARAETIRKAVLEKGIEPEKVTSAFYGAEKPVLDCPKDLKGDELKACLQPNRRVDVITEGWVNMEK